jgi:hypothetical protein
MSAALLCYQFSSLSSNLCGEHGLDHGVCPPTRPHRSLATRSSWRESSSSHSCCSFCGYVSSLYPMPTTNVATSCYLHLCDHAVDTAVCLCTYA